MSSIRIWSAKQPKFTCFNCKNITTNLTDALAVRKRWCRCSSERNNDHVIGELFHTFSCLVLELSRFSSGLTV